MTVTTSRLRSRLFAILAAVFLIAAACGSDDDDGDTAADDGATETTEAAAEDDAAEDDAAAEADDAAAEDDAAEDDAAAEEDAGSDDAAAAEGQAVELGEWFITPDGDVASGTTTFAITNVSDEFPHALAIARGTSYEELPQIAENGAVDTDALGADFLGTTDNIEPGEMGSIEFDLEPGDYVFFCPIAFGPNSHAAAGQVLSVTIG